MMQTRRYLGITVMPEYVQVEGGERVLDNLLRVGVTAVTTSPYVMEQADEKTGTREPPAVEEVESKDGHITIFAPPAEFYKAKTALHEAFPDLELEVQEITFLPQVTKTLSGDELASFERFLGMLNDCDDVQEIYQNVSLPS